MMFKDILAFFVNVIFLLVTANRDCSDAVYLYLNPLEPIARLKAEL